MALLWDFKSAIRFFLVTGKINPLAVLGEDKLIGAFACFAKTVIDHFQINAEGRAKTGEKSHQLPPLFIAIRLEILMFKDDNVQFSVEDGINLHTWLFVPQEKPSRFLAIGMAHGFAGFRAPRLSDENSL